jgi:hypothetical protein
VGKATVGELVAQHGGLVEDKGRGHTFMLIVWWVTYQARQRSTRPSSVESKISTLDTLEQLLQGALTFQEFIYTLAPVIENYSEGFQVQHQEWQANTTVAEATAGQAEVESPKVPRTGPQLGHHRSTGGVQHP